MTNFDKMRAARFAWLQNPSDVNLFAAYNKANEQYLFGTRKPRYGLVAVITAAVTTLAFGGAALAYQAQNDAPRLVCSSAMPDSESDFSELHEFGKSTSDGYYRELVKIGCKVNPKAGR